MAIIEHPRQKTKRGQGQWGLGYHEPLNAAERVKRDDDGLNVRERIETIFAKEGFRSIGPQDLRSRFRWWGLYTQRRQGVSAQATATAEPEELEDEFFMMRIRIPGGQLTSDQLRAIAWASERFGRDVADVTDRQNIQLHWIRIEDVPRIWERIEPLGLSTQEACGDTPRNMLGCPLAGIAADELIDATPYLLETNRRFVGDPAFSNLPRKYKTTITGCRHRCTHPEINDVAFVATSRDGRIGFDVWVGGGLSTNPHMAKSLGVLVEPEYVPDVWGAVTATFRDYGYRRSRNHARLKFLVADWGPDRFRDVVEQEYLGFALPDGGPLPSPPPSGTRDHVGAHLQKDGRAYVGFAPSAGRIYGHQLRRVADLADAFAAGRIRTTTEQKMAILDVPPDRVDELMAALGEEDLPARPGAFRRGVMACTGIEFCKLAIAETKMRAQWLYRELEERMPSFDEDIRINVNGCPNSCARFQVADIGLMGAILPRPDGTRSDGFLVHLGGGLGDDPRFGTKVKGVRIFAEDIADYLETLIRRYLLHRNGHASFREYVRSLSPEEIARFAEPPGAFR